MRKKIERQILHLRPLAESVVKRARPIVVVKIARRDESKNRQNGVTLGLCSLITGNYCITPVCYSRSSAPTFDNLWFALFPRRSST